MVEEGSVASISQSQYQLGIETANQVLQLLKGKAVSDIPVKVVDDGKPLINRKVAEELGITISPRLLKTATVIE